MTLSRVVLVDRDGVLIYDDDYVFDPATVRLIPGASHAIAELRGLGFVVICVTNQRGVSIQKPHASIAAVDACNRRMQELLYAENPAGSFLDIRYAPQDNDDTRFRKPHTGLIDSIRPWVDVAYSFAIGDREHDLLLGVNFGIPADHCIRVRTGKPTPVPGYLEVQDLREASASIAGIVKQMAVRARDSHLFR